MNVTIPAENIENILPLTQMQQEMLFSHLMNPSGNEYFEQQCYRLIGRMNPQLVEEAFNEVVYANDMLRAVILWEGLRQPVQVIKRKVDIPFQYFNWSCDKEAKNKLHLLMDSLWEKRVDIRVHPFCVTFCSVSNEEHYLIWTYHHILLDGWSNAILLKEFYQCYGAVQSGRKAFETKKSPFSNYIGWLQSQDKQSALHFWKTIFADYSELKLERGNASERSKNASKQIYTFQIDAVLYKELKQVIHQYNITIASLFYWMWANTLSVMSGEQVTGAIDVLFGITVSGRPPVVPEISNLVGLFIRTLPLRVRCDRQKDYLLQIRKIAMDILEIEKHQHVFLSEIMPRSKQPGYNLLNSVVVIQNYALDSALLEDRADLFDIALYDSKYETNLDITLGVKTFMNHLEVEFSYKDDVYSTRQIQRICESWRVFLREMSSDPEKAQWALIDGWKTGTGDDHGKL